MATTTRKSRDAQEPAAPFRGFDRDAMQFWHELASHMSKEWFTENKQRYQSVWVEPMMTLLREVAGGLGAGLQTDQAGRARGAAHLPRPALLRG